MRFPVYYLQQARQAILSSNKYNLSSLMRAFCLGGARYDWEQLNKWWHQSFSLEHIALYIIIYLHVQRTSTLHACKIDHNNYIVMSE